VESTAKEKEMKTWVFVRGGGSGRRRRLGGHGNYSTENSVLL